MVCRRLLSEEDVSSEEGEGYSVEGWKGGCAHEGRMRYSQDCLFSWRGAVKAVPESFSA
jgi:hypothetical protein